MPIWVGGRKCGEEVVGVRRKGRDEPGYIYIYIYLGIYIYIHTHTYIMYVIIRKEKCTRCDILKT